MSERGHIGGECRESDKMRMREDAEVENTEKVTE